MPTLRSQWHKRYINKTANSLINRIRKRTQFQYATACCLEFAPLLNNSKWQNTPHHKTLCYLQKKFHNEGIRWGDRRTVQNLIPMVTHFVYFCFNQNVKPRVQHQRKYWHQNPEWPDRIPVHSLLIHWLYLWHDFGKEGYFSQSVNELWTESQCLHTAGGGSNHRSLPLPLETVPGTVRLRCRLHHVLYFWSC